MTNSRRLLLSALTLVACESRLCRDPQVEQRLAPKGVRTLPQKEQWTMPVYTAPHVTAPPVIDGKLDDAVWDKAPWTPYFRRSNVDAPGTQKTRARMVWDDANLYVAFEVEDADIISVDPSDGHAYVTDDDTLYQSEVVEVFLDANADLATYNEIEVSPLNKLFDASFIGRRQGMNLGWSSGTRHAVQVNGTVNDEHDTDHGWTAELAIPFANLMALQHSPPQAGERWRFNLYRLDHGRGINEGQAFSPVMIGDFHALPKFGELVLGGP